MSQIGLLCPEKVAKLKLFYSLLSQQWQITNSTWVYKSWLLWVHCFFNFKYKNKSMRRHQSINFSNFKNTLSAGWYLKADDYDDFADNDVDDLYSDLIPTKGKVSQLPWSVSAQEKVPESFLKISILPEEAPTATMSLPIELAPWANTSSPVGVHSYQLLW